MIKNLKTILLTGWLALITILPKITSAQNPATLEPDEDSLLGRLKKVGGDSYNTDMTTPEIAGTVIGAFLGFIGIVFIVLTVMAGFSWMTAGGNEEKVKKAVAVLKNALIGMVLSLSAWSLWTFVFRNLIGLG